ncbi:hypothetical protein [Paenibacillus polymyxa]|uniref:Uncharacterized protein n=1 Tax=Paenibacillus polymyxa (strain SC2) TaxID=886882 RepID=E3EKG1_PAEPS|nr:hypothetical protein [Paenibacillus polymyxa]ADO59793.1 hypothetical protein PPSC2_26195 [Paenibacillus polymyxa SC2]WPQ59972.1 hypothetical protein SKN87_27400 [Paenibacillus polymyxa]
MNKLIGLFFKGKSIQRMYNSSDDAVYTIVRKGNELFRIAFYKESEFVKHGVLEICPSSDDGELYVWEAVSYSELTRIPSEYQDIFNALKEKYRDKGSLRTLEEFLNPF